MDVPINKFLGNIFASHDGANQQTLDSPRGQPHKQQGEVDSGFGMSPSVQFTRTCNLADIRV
jgi:hypothetical protein